MDKIILTDKPKDFGDFFSCKIISTYNAYKNIQNSVFAWTSLKSSYCLWGDNLTVSGSVDKNFVDFLSPKTVLCSRENAMILGLKTLQSGEIMRKKLEYKSQEISPFHLDNPKEVFALLKNNNMAEDYHGFWADISLRLRNSLAMINMYFDNQELVSLALCSYITETSAIITAVVTDKNFRNCGYAKKLILELEKKLADRYLYLLKEFEINNGFYESLSYDVCGKWVIGERIKYVSLF